MFGLTLTDFFSDTAYEVELEKDLSLKQQFLDVVVIEKREGRPLSECPDGFDDLAKHNLLTYKSHQQVLDEWTIHELVGHYVNYRKQISPLPDSMLPAGDFRLYAVSTRFPGNLAKAVSFESVTEGVYDIRWGNLRVRVIVLGKIGEKPENAIWQMFSAAPDKVQSGAKTYRWRKRDISGAINELFHKYRIEGVAMPYTVEDFQRDYVREHIHKMPLEDRLQGLSTDDILKKLSTDDILKRLSVEDRFKGLTTEDRFKGLSSEDMVNAIRKHLAGLTSEEKKAFVDELLKSYK